MLDLRRAFTLPFDFRKIKLDLVRFSNIVKGEVTMPSIAIASNFTDSEFAIREHQLTALIEDWVDRECTSFDDAVRKAAGLATVGPSIWDMPTIDSKRVVSLLIELEPVLERRLPAALIRKGGYASGDDLKTDLVPKLKHLAISGKAKLLTTATQHTTSAVMTSPTAVNTNAQVANDR